MNLLKETVEFLEENGKSPRNVMFVCNDVSCMSFDDFCLVADKINYDNGYGAAEIDEALKIVGDNWWLERHEYDGSEWWEFKTLPSRENKKVILREPSIKDAILYGR